MNDKIASLDINELYDLFTFSYTIPIEFRDIVKTAINRYAQPYKRILKKHLIGWLER